MSAHPENFKVDMAHLQKVQRTLRKAGNIFPNEKELVATLEDLIIKAQDDTSLNTYYHMAQYLKQRLKELKSNLDQPLEVIDTAIENFKSVDTLSPMACNRAKI